METMKLPVSKQHSYIECITIKNARKVMLNEFGFLSQMILGSYQASQILLNGLKMRQRMYVFYGT